MKKPFAPLPPLQTRSLLSLFHLYFYILSCSHLESGLILFLSIKYIAIAIAIAIAPFPSLLLLPLKQRHPDAKKTQIRTTFHGLYFLFYYLYLFIFFNFFFFSLCNCFFLFPPEIHRGHYLILFFQS